MKLCSISLLVFLLFLSCSLSDNYPHPEKPFYTHDFRAKHTQVAPDTLKLVSYNIKYSRQPEKALNLLTSHTDLADADIILLQEMQNKDVKRIAQELQCEYIYFPATSHVVAGHDFGNAILSRFNLENPQKIVLPHLNPVNKSIRIAVLSTVIIGSKKIRVVSLHLETFLMRSGKKQDQIKTVLQKTRNNYDGIIIGGDFNTPFRKGKKMIQYVMHENGYYYVTQNLKYTSRFAQLPLLKFKLDHIFTKQIKPIECGRVVNFSASDHLPLWFTFSF